MGRTPIHIHLCKDYVDSLAVCHSKRVSGSLAFLPIEEIIYVLITPLNPIQLYTGQLKSALPQAHSVYFLPPTQGFSLNSIGLW